MLPSMSNKNAKPAMEISCVICCITLKRVAIHHNTEIMIIVVYVTNIQKLPQNIIMNQKHYK